jgi:hypothetical protein
MKPELTQAELTKYVADGKTAIWQYNTLYYIDYSSNLGSGEYYLRKVHQKSDPGQHGGVTRRGRFIAMDPHEARKYL